MKHQNKKSSWPGQYIAYSAGYSFTGHLAGSENLFLPVTPTVMGAFGQRPPLAVTVLKEAELPTSGQPQAAPLTGETIPSWRAALASWKMLNDQTNKDVVINNGPSLVIARLP